MKNLTINWSTAKTAQTLIKTGISALLETLQLIGKHGIRQTLVKPMENELSSDCENLTINRTQRANSAGPGQESWKPLQNQVIL